MLRHPAHPPVPRPAANQAGGFAAIDGFMGVKNDDTHAGMFAALPEIRLRNQSLTLVDLRRA